MINHVSRNRAWGCVSDLQTSDYPGKRFRNFYGISTRIEQLTLKSILDFFTSIAFAAALGWGVAVSALPVGIYQFARTGVGFALGAILEPYQVSAMTATGGVLLLGIALKLVNIKQIAIGNPLPAIALAPIFALLARII